MFASLADMRLSAERVAAARRVIDPSLLATPVVRDGDVLLKDETVGRLGCFKGRGADLFVAQRHERTPLVCASAGNFGLALADAGRRRGVPVTVFVSRHANPRKVARIRSAGGEVIVAGDDFDAAKEAARAHRGGQFVEDGDIAAISEGAGTIAAELGEQLATVGFTDLDFILVPVGNGALIAGIGTWMRAHHPQTRVIGVCATGAPVMRDCWRERRVVDPPARVGTIADGIAVRVPVPAAVEDLGHVVDDMLLVDDDQLRAAMQALRARTGIIAEPSAVAGLALAHQFTGRVATILTGGNV
jgi:threonine dehydratase